MKSFVVLASLVLGAGVLAGCDGSGARSTADKVSSGEVAADRARAAARAREAAFQGEPPRDRDGDRDNLTRSYYDKDDKAVLHYGRVATPAEQQTVKSLVRQYYFAAAAADGDKACALMYSILVEAIPEDYGETSGPLHGKTCGEVMSKLFKQHQQKLARELAALKIIGVRTEGNLGWAILNFGQTKPPGHIRIRLDNGTWKIRDLLPSGLP